MQRSRALATSVAMTLVIVAACGGTVASSGASLPPPATVTAPAASPSPGPSASATLQAANGPIPVPFPCTEERPCPLPPGSYVLTGEFVFMPGLTVTIPVHSTSPEQGLGGFGFTPDGAPGGLLFWKDLTPVARNGTPVPGVDPSTAGMVDWLRSDPDFVTSVPKPIKLGDDIPAVTLLLGVSSTARNGDPDCPVAVCVALFTDTAHWEVPYAIGREPTPLYVRLYLADVLTGSTPHTLVVALDAGDAAGLGKLQPIADRILETIRLPPGTRPA